MAGKGTRPRNGARCRGHTETFECFFHWKSDDNHFLLEDGLINLVELTHIFISSN